MPLPLTVSCFTKIQIGFTFLVPAHLGSPRKGPLNGCVCVGRAANFWFCYSKLTTLTAKWHNSPHWLCNSDDEVHNNVWHLDMECTPQASLCHHDLVAAQHVHIQAMLYQCTISKGPISCINVHSYICAIYQNNANWTDSLSKPLLMKHLNTGHGKWHQMQTMREGV